jgi:disulfide oxidoreductase YuzD
MWDYILSFFYRLACWLCSSQNGYDVSAPQKPIEPRVDYRDIDFKEYYKEAKTQVTQEDVDKLPETVMYIVKTMFLTLELPYPLESIKRYVNLIITQAIVRVHPDKCSVTGLDSKKAEAITRQLSDLKDKANGMILCISHNMMFWEFHEQKRRQGVFNYSQTYGGATIEGSPWALAKSYIITFRFFEGDSPHAAKVSRSIAHVREYQEKSQEQEIRHKKAREEQEIRHQKARTEREQARVKRQKEREEFYREVGITSKQNNSKVKSMACKLQYEEYLQRLSSIEDINVDGLTEISLMAKAYIANNCDKSELMTNKKFKQLVTDVELALYYNSKGSSMQCMVVTYINNIKRLVNDLKKDLANKLSTVEFVEEAKMQEYRDNSLTSKVDHPVGLIDQVSSQHQEFKEEYDVPVSSDALFVKEIEPENHLKDYVLSSNVSSNVALYKKIIQENIQKYEKYIGQEQLEKLKSFQNLDESSDVSEVADRVMEVVDVICHGSRTYGSFH